jgi:hypothetical protein
MNLNPKLRERHFSSCPVDVEIYDLNGSPTAGNRPDPGSNELFNDVAAPKYSTGEMKSTPTVSNPHYPVIEFGSVHRSQGRDRAGKGVSWARVARNFRHIDLQTEPIRVPVVGEVGLAAGSNLDLSDPFSGVLAPGVEGAARMLSVVELPVTDLDNLGNNYQFVESDKGVNTEVTAEGFHDPNKFRHLKKRRRRKLVDLHRKGIQNRRQNQVAGEPESIDEEITKDDNHSILRGRDLFVKWGSPSARREELGFLIFPNHIGRDFGLSKDKRGWQRSCSICFNQITDGGVHIPDIFVIVCLNLPILATPGATRRACIVSWCSILNTFDNWINWETSRDKFFGSHGSRGAFDSSHLTNRVTRTKK